MKILVVSQYFWPENFRINDLVIELKDRGHDVTVLTGMPNYPDGEIFVDYKSDPKKYSFYFGIEVIRVPIVPRGNKSWKLLLNYISFSVSASLLGLVKLRGRKFDRIFVFEPSPITVGLPAILIRYVKKAPVLFWVLDLWPETLKAVGIVKSEYLLKLVGYLVTYIYNHCDLILVQSRSFMNSVANHIDSHDKIRYFPSWAENIFLDNDVKSAPEIPVPSSSVFSIMFAGNIGEAQDFPSILEAAELLNERDDIRWVIVGSGRMESWVRNECQKRNIEDKFIFAGRFPLERMPSFYKSADALLVSLKDEDIFTMTIPGKVQSYLAAGKPIIGMLDGEGAKIIIEAGAGFVCGSANSRGLAKIISDMASVSKEHRDQMAQSGKEYYTREFDKSMLIDRLESWLGEIKYEQ